MIFLAPNFFDLFYPPVCVVCGKTHINWICSNCIKRLSKYKKEKYDEKPMPVIYDSMARNIQVNRFFDSLFYLYDYRNIIRSLIIKYKFEDSSYISHFFVNEILNSKKFNEILSEYDIMSSVPMDKKSERNRGYNQTAIILNYLRNRSLGKKIKISTNNIIKIKKTKRQSSLNGIDREKNVKGAFKLLNPEEVLNKNIIIFDDIYTTGSTINEISKLLKIHGARKVLAFVLAKD